MSDFLLACFILACEEKFKNNISPKENGTSEFGNLLLFMLQITKFIQPSIMMNICTQMKTNKKKEEERKTNIPKEIITEGSPQLYYVSLSIKKKKKKDV